MDRRLDTALERIISAALRIGLAASAFMLVVGIAMFFLAPGQGAIQAIDLAWLESASLKELLAEPAAWLSCGIGILMFTPILRVVITAVTFSAERDWRYTGVSILVLLVISVGIAIAFLG